jgi:hypothetical protein
MFHVLMVPQPQPNGIGIATVLPVRKLKGRRRLIVVDRVIAVVSLEPTKSVVRDGKG